MRGSGSGTGKVPSVSGDKRQPVPEAALSSGGETTDRCPRCGSHNTKFCYFNNYNLAQPRHFCKACRRYWTLGGTLRNVPIGGSTRRSTQQQNRQQASSSSTARRLPAPTPASASASASPSSSSSSSPTMTSLTFDAPSIAPLSDASKADTGTANESSMDAVRSFESLLSEPLPAGFLALGDPFLGGRGDGLGLGLGLGGSPGEIIDEIGFGIGRAAPVWPFFGDDDVSVLAGGSSAADGGLGGIEPECDAWQVVASGTELVGGDYGDCFGWPELAISMTPGKGVL